MSGYTVEVRTGILTGEHVLHTWLVITHPDGTKEAWGFHPATDSAGNILYGPGDVRPENPEAPSTATSGPLDLTQEQYESLMDHIAAEVRCRPTIRCWRSLARLSAACGRSMCLRMRGYFRM
jgi:hypothetical protein